MTKEKKNESVMTIADLWHLCAARWRWFVLSIFVCLSIAVFYLLTTPYLYTRKASIMVLEESLGKNSTESNSNDFDDIGFVNQKSNVTNVARHITSLNILMEVVRRMNDSSLTSGKIIKKAKDIQSRLSADLNEGPSSTIINLAYKDFSTIEAEDILSLIIQVYNEKWLNNKQQVTKNTSQFIDSRLRLLEKDLDRVDDSISTYKSRYGITDLQHVSDIYLQQQSQSNAELLNLSNQKAMAEYIRNLLNDKSSQPQLLLANSGISNTVIETQISLYNSLLLQLQSHLEYTSDQNPLIISKQKELNNLRNNILANINNHIRSIDIQLLGLEGYHSEASSKITSNPNQAKYLVTIEREQKVKESLYLYLLQKKEENEISLTYKSAPTEVLDIPHGSGKPTSPNRILVLFAAVLFGVLIPLTILFLRASFDESVRDHFDIERNCDIPFLGEVPYSGREHSLESLLMPFGIGEKAKSGGIVVGPDILNPSNEAFRVLRNNTDSIDVNKSTNKTCRVYLLKSTEVEVGKTYVGMNLALTKAIDGSRVLFIDGDLRQASASRLWRTPLLGLTDYLQGEVSNYQKLLWHPEGYPTMDVLPAGALPTNPTELLNSPLFGELINTLKQQYDSIFIDSPSAGILADADIIERYVDCTLLIIRAGRFNRHRLNELSPIQVINGSTKPQYIILNGVNIDARYGFYYSTKYERSEEDKNITSVDKKNSLFSQIIFKKKNHQQS